MHHQLDVALRHVTALVATGVGTLTAVTLLAAVITEVLRRRRIASEFVRRADRLLPAPGRRLAAAVVTTVALALPGTAGVAGAARTPATGVTVPTADGPTGAGSLREWLTEPAPEPAPHPDRAPSLPTSTTSTTTSSTTRPHDPPASRSQPPDRVRPRRPVPTAPSPEPVPGAAPTVAPAAAPPVVTVTVQPGDCLWSIAARRLAPAATNAEIDRTWRAIWAVNRDAIGADPDLIHPGLILVVGPSVP